LTENLHYFGNTKGATPTITLEIPRALLPLVNIPLLDYTIEFLASAGVEEIFVFCCSHAKQIQNHLSQNKWSSSVPGSGLVVKPVISLTSLSAGDALREMYNNGFIKHDFILVSDDVVSNMKLDKAFQAQGSKGKRQKLHHDNGSKTSSTFS